jgi:hypothetical protein
MYVRKSVTPLIEARDGVLRLMQEVLLTNEERGVAEGDVEALSRYIKKRTYMSTPSIPNKSSIFNL